MSVATKDTYKAGEGNPIIAIKYNKPNVHAFGDLEGKEVKALMPGWNEFPLRMWTKYESHPDVKKMLADKVIEIHPTMKALKKGVKAPEEFDVTKLAESDATKVVGETFSRDLLNRWQDEETRSKVKKAIRERITDLFETKDET